MKKNEIRAAVIERIEMASSKSEAYKQGLLSGMATAFREAGLLTQKEASDLVFDILAERF